MILVTLALTLTTTFAVQGTANVTWSKILGSVGLAETKITDASIIIAGETAPASTVKLADDHILVLIGHSPAAQLAGIQPAGGKLAIRQICDLHAPKTEIIWEQPVETESMQIPMNFRVFAQERWKASPVLAGRKTEHGAILWLATEPGPTGIERYPYLLQALADLGLQLPAQSNDLWAFFDSSYRIRADVDYLAARWRKAGISVLHVAAWHNMEPDPIQDAFLKRLISACHEHAILVYAWFELPHVSEKFWADHPEWREKTGLGQDAQLDWRKLMDLQNRECRKAAAVEVRSLLGRFDWDGVNLAELYFESLEGASNPARFTPMNDTVRADFMKVGGFDPKLLFDKNSPHSAANNSAALQKFLDYRARLASRMQTEWLDIAYQTSKLDVVVTHIDDQFEPGMRDALGADVARTLPVIQARGGTFLVEDPATLWNLGPERYARLGEKYRQLNAQPEQTAVDINVVDRYQDVYPTKKQTGVELLELVHQAAASFSRVALYFENSLEKQDLALLPAAAVTARVITESDQLHVQSKDSVRIAWQGPVRLDGKLWPVQNATSVLVPSGNHRLAVAPQPPSVTIVDFNGTIQAAVASTAGVELSYISRARAIAALDAAVSKIEVDGAPYWSANSAEPQRSFMLPAGQHFVSFIR